MVKQISSLILYENVFIMLFKVSRSLIQIIMSENIESTENSNVPRNNLVAMDFKQALRESLIRQVWEHPMAELDETTGNTNYCTRNHFP